MMRYLLIAIFAVVCAFTATAQTWSAGAPSETVLTDYDQTFTYSYSAAGESDNLDVSACTKPTVTINGNNDVTGYSCPTASASRPECVPVVASAQPFGPTPVAFPGGFAKFQVSGFSAASSVVVACNGVTNRVHDGSGWVSTQPAGTALVRGIDANGICRDECRQWLQSRITDGTETFPLPARVYFFSTNAGGSIPTVGVDTNAGTFDSPLFSLAKCNEIIEAGAICALDGGAADAWDTQAEWAGGAFPVHGALFTNVALVFDGANCAPGTFCGGVIGWGDERAVIDGGGLDPLFDPDGAGTQNSPGDLLVGAVRIFDPNNTSMLFGNLDFTNLPPTSNREQDVIRHESGIGSYMLAWNIRCPDIQGGNNQCYTSHMDNSRWYAFGGGVTLLDDAPVPSSITHQAVAAVNPGNVVFWWGGEFTDQVVGDSSVFASFIYANGIGTGPPGTLWQTMLDSTVRSTGADDGLRHIAFSPQTNRNGDTVYTYLDNIFCEGWNQTDEHSGCIHSNMVGSLATSGLLHTRVYRMTSSDIRSFFYHVGHGVGSQNDFRARCNVIPDVGAKLFRMGGVAGSCPTDVYDIAYTVWDESGATPFQIEGNSYSTAALAKAGSVTLGCNGGAGYSNFFNDASLESDATTEYAGLDALGLCAPGGDCFNACPLSEIEDHLFPDGPMPAWAARFIFGQDVKLRGFGPSSGTGHAGKNF